ncbi:hypothetical protein KIN20_030826 [Parelaphostrongylus tenuis]|uniref:Uncharacterized protein n=1 Tax=Parelaphostrongylus tenuis TaxID=148309 RepID=A0AAD5R4K5_PARTN|nr:hypothetical protein KIN20_030826 [Parelaphostrongylus tenuis]
MPRRNEIQMDQLSTLESHDSIRLPHLSRPIRHNDIRSLQKFLSLQRSKGKDLMQTDMVPEIDVCMTGIAATTPGIVVRHLLSTFFIVQIAFTVLPTMMQFWGIAGSASRNYRCYKDILYHSSKLEKNYRTHQSTN